MADRLEFNFVRTGKITQVGNVSVDVLDPTDENEIALKLKEQSFAEYLVTGFEIDGEQFQFQPVIELELSNDDS